MHTSNESNSLTVSLLDANRLGTSLRSSYHFYMVLNAHCEASFNQSCRYLRPVAVLRLHILYKVKLRADNSNIAAQNSLLIALSSQLRFELMLVTDKG